MSGMSPAMTPWNTGATPAYGAWSPSVGKCVCVCVRVSAYIALCVVFFFSCLFFNFVLHLLMFDF